MNRRRHVLNLAAAAAVFVYAVTQLPTVFLAGVAVGGILVGYVACIRIADLQYQARRLAIDLRESRAHRAELTRGLETAALELSYRTPTVEGGDVG